MAPDVDAPPAGAELPTHRVRARNLAGETENRIHADDVARRYGFEGGLVAGVTTYAYLTRPVVEALGEPWLERGTFSVRLLQPVYDGERIEVVARVERSDAAGVELQVEAQKNDGELCAVGTAGLAADPPETPDPGEWPEAALPEPADRLPATPEVMASLDALGTVSRTFRAERAGEFLDAIDDDLPLYREGGPAHPGWIVFDANQVLARTVKLGPWIHTGTVATHFSTVRDGDVVATRGKVARVFERKGHQIVEADLLVVAGERPVWHLRHTAIFQIADPTR